MGPPVGYLFADIEGSTERWEATPTRMLAAVTRLNVLLDEIVTRHGGVIQDRAGDGVFATFRAGNPLQCALDLQVGMQSNDWSAVGGLALRIGVHAAEDNGSVATERAAANRAGRIMSSAWGGQIVVSREALDRFRLPSHAEALDHGACRLKGIADSMRLSTLRRSDVQSKEFPPLRTLQFEGLNVDATAGPFFGRQHEQAAVMARLSESRLVSIVGAGGNGKTRLALQIVSEIGATQRVCVVSLEAIRDAADLPILLASALGLSSFGDARGQVIDYLRDTRAFVLLDNAELIAGRAGFVTSLLNECPNISVLVTSREPLGLIGESLLRLSGMSAAEEDGESQSAALRLFKYEARLKVADYDIEDSQLATFREICELVQGSPLALRLTAQWVGVLTLEEIRERLQFDIDMLSQPNGRLDRKSLRGVFEGTWRLLTPALQTALADLSVFAAPFDAEAARGVAAVDLSVLGSLVNKGLLARNKDGRFAMHVSVRTYAYEKLARRDKALEAARNRHARYCLDAVRASVERNDPSTATAARAQRLRSSFADIRAAWAFALEANETATAERSIEALCYFLYTQSMLREAVDLFSIAARGEQMGLWARAIRASFLVQQGDVQAASTEASEVLTSARAPPLAEAHAIHTLGNVAHVRGDFDVADARYAQAFEMRLRLHDVRGAAYSAVARGALHTQFARPQVAGDLIKEGYRLARRADDAFCMMMVHIYAGDIAAFEGRFDDASANYEQSLRLEEFAGHHQFRAMLKRRLGGICRQQGDHVRALALHEEGAELALAVGDERSRAQALLEIGVDRRRLGHWRQARKSLLASARIARSLDMPPVLAQALSELALVEHAAGNLSRAAAIVQSLNGEAPVSDQEAHGALQAQLRGSHFADCPPRPLRDLLEEAIDADELDSLKL